jgi:hypothetical protein
MTRRKLYLVLLIFSSWACSQEEPCGPLEVGDEIVIVIQERLSEDTLPLGHGLEDGSCAELFEEGDRIGLEVVGEYPIEHHPCLLLEAKISTPANGFEVGGGDLEVRDSREVSSWLEISSTLSGVAANCFGGVGLDLGEALSGPLEGELILTGTFQPAPENYRPGANNPYCDEQLGPPRVPDPAETHSCTAMYRVTLE